MGMPVWVRAEGHGGLSGLAGRLERCAEHFLGIGRGWSRDDEMLQYYGMRLNVEALSPPQLKAAAMEAGMPLVELLPPYFKMRNSHQRRCRSRSRQ
jgi:hypothetical protein